jgi:hypothetical protein
MNQNIAMPIDLKEKDGRLCVVSVRLPRDYFTEPFLLDTLKLRFGIASVNTVSPEEQRALVRPLHFDENDDRISYTPLNDFVAQAETTNVEKIKFLFHMSRCGSTLATQMLGASKKFYVLSEPPIVNRILDPGLKLPDGIGKMEILKATIHALASCKPESAEETVIKFRSWNTLFIKDILCEFPKTEWFFIHRKGVEVLESVLRNPPGWMRGREQNEEFFSSFMRHEPDEEIGALPFDEYAIRLLGAFCAAAGKAHSDHAYYIDYQTISTDLADLVVKNWSVRLDEGEREAMRAQTLLYSKDPSKTKEFVPDMEQKSEAATEHQRELADLYIEKERQSFARPFAEWNSEFTSGSFK